MTLIWDTWILKMIFFSIPTFSLNTDTVHSLCKLREVTFHVTHSTNWRWNSYICLGRRKYLMNLVLWCISQVGVNDRSVWRLCHIQIVTSLWFSQRNTFTFCLQFIFFNKCDNSIINYLGTWIFLVHAFHFPYKCPKYPKCPNHSWTPSFTFL
jgi:hypothetical protein